MMSKTYKEIQQDLTELNSDGNRGRGEDGEDESPEKKVLNKPNVDTNEEFFKSFRRRQETDSQGN